jgi:cation diffusion facilitator CzcD-associated flavoprotein CzcO
MQNYDVVVVGAGPYGLSAAVHLQAIRGLRVRAFGKPMTFWEKNMPAGMFLRSPWEATHIPDPKGKLTLDAYVAACGNHLSKPIPLDRFIDYGRWFQKCGVADLDLRDINRIERTRGGFQLAAEDGEVMYARRVVVAAGIAKFAWRPREFEKLSESLASHSCNQTNLAAFAGKKVLVIGGGQSALESGALLHEIGADVEIIIRKPQVHYLRWRSRLFHYRPIGRFLYSPRDVGPAGISQLTARPDFLRLFPRKLQDWVDHRSIRPAGAAWLIDRLKDVPIRTNLYPQSATPTGKQVRVRYNDGNEQTADHLLFATGYRIDIAKYNFLAPELVRETDQINGYPRLKSGLESSVSGLHFLGAPAAWSFGPVTRFISGTYYCVQALTRAVAAME